MKKRENIGKIYLKDYELKIQLNESKDTNGKYNINVHNEYFKLILSEEDYLKIASCILYARDKILYYKGKEENE